MKFLTLFLCLAFNLGYTQPFRSEYKQAVKSNIQVDAKNGFRDFKLGSDIRKYFNRYSFENLTEKRSVIRIYTLSFSEFENSDLKTIYGTLINSITFFCYNDYKIGAIIVQTGINDSNANIITNFRKELGKEVKNKENNQITYLWTGNYNNILCSKRNDNHGDAYIESISIYQKKYVPYRDKHKPNDGL